MPEILVALGTRAAILAPVVALFIVVVGVAVKRGEQKTHR